MLALLESPECWIAFLTLSLLETVLGIDNVIFLSIWWAATGTPGARAHRRADAGDADAPGAAVYGGVADAADHAAVQRAAARVFVARPDPRAGACSCSATAPPRFITRSKSRGRAATRALGPSTCGDPDRAYRRGVLARLGIHRRRPGAPGSAADHGGAIVVSIAVMMWLSGPIAAFVTRHRALSAGAAFLVLIGAALVCEALEFEVPKGYLYFAMAFSVAVELVNIRLQRLLGKSPR